MESGHGEAAAASARTLDPKERGSREETPDLFLFLPASLLSMSCKNGPETKGHMSLSDIVCKGQSARV